MGTASRWFSNALKTSLIGLALAATTVWADPPGRVGRISDTAGTVWFYEPEQGEWVAARRNRPVTDGDRFATERGARVEVQIGSATVRLGGGTEASFDELDDEHIRLQLTRGSAALQLRRDELAREVAVITPQGRFEPLRSGRYRVDVEERSVFGATLAGAMRYEARDSALTIESGQRAEFWRERGDSTHYAWTDLPNDNFAEWVRREEREDRDQRYASPEMTGADDLHRHGNWERHADYGTIWYPHSVGAGWAPYRDGQWAYVRPWGWTWVDNAAWGFAPFHYGRWVHHRGRWGWIPGQMVARPVYSPALVGWIGNGNVSVSINVGHPGYVGWVPLSPYDLYRPYYTVSPRYIHSVNVPYQHWHRGPRHIPGREPVMAGAVPYTNQGVAGGVTVVSRDVLRQRQPITQGSVAPVANVSQWQRVQPEAPAVMATPRAAGITPPPTVFRNDDGREGVRRGPSRDPSRDSSSQVLIAPQTAPTLQAAQPNPIPMPSARPQTPPQTPAVVSLPAATVTQPRPNAAPIQVPQPQQQQQQPIPIPTAPSARVQAPAVVSLPANTVVQPHPGVVAQQEAQRRHAAQNNEREQREARAQEQQQRREQVRRMERHAPGQQRHD
jgi:hypothetical protein